MIARYAPREIAATFSDESRLRRWLQVELLVCEGWAALGRIPEPALRALRAVEIDAERAGELEAEQGHDVAAFVSALQERLGDEGRYLHLGITSSDVVDTALATQLRDAAAIIDADAQALEDALSAQAVRHRMTVMVGRTHGVHAEPLTLGVKLANHYDEVRRSRQRLAAAAREVAVGQVSGAVGTHATVPPQVEEHVCRALGLGVAPVTTQVIARDRHAAFLSAEAILAAVLDRLATTVRLLQATEVGELAEPFGDRQKGSSAMPHKRNPVLSERISGLARVLRGHSVVALEDVALWHERDISHSSAERVILPEACALLDFMLREALRVVSGLTTDSERMRANLERDGEIVFSQRVLSALITEAGWSRERAYRTIQQLAARARGGEEKFRTLVRSSPEVAGALDAQTLEACFDVAAHLANIDETYRRLGLAGAVGGSDGRIPQADVALAMTPIESGTG